ncbi:hypothetical protein LHP98_12145 [Rhodobacter sp. Har01]|uniref:tetratricopeptide repeat protein n=1 Tax=Rhodobacter sp. Har01 TaxID=2883999 RepID=UPI001D08CDE4|nr:hypothetical protein [Rhodobacter sp. Har01]MCB6178877.1 hypothetical protein [Rhodobacter sp. Har01]
MAFAACIGLWVGDAQPVFAEERLSIEEGRTLAVVLVRSGQPTAARVAAKALLTRDPDDVVALLVLARAARDLGFYDEAASAARRAFRLAPEGSRDRFGASLAMAQALASDGKRGRAQFWLRRAAQEAPDKGARAVALRDLNYVRARNPLSVKLQFNVFPSSNVNGGPTTNVLVVGGLEFVNPDAVPLSGAGVTLGFDATLRLAGTEANQVFAGVSVESTSYQLSDRARALVPTARAEDYATAQAVLLVGWAGRRDWGRMSARLSFGRDWRGGDPLADWTRLSLSAERGFGDLGVGDLSLALTDRDRKDLSIRSSEELSLGAGWTWTLGSGDRLRLGLDLGKVWSDAASVARHSTALNLSWRRAKPVLGMQVSAFGSLEVTDYERPLELLGTEHDVTAELGVTAVLSDYDVLGFAPEVGFVLSRTESNISALTTEAAELRLGIHSLY